MARSTTLNPASPSSASAAQHLRELDWLMFVTVALCCLGLVMAVSIVGARWETGAIAAMQTQGGKLLIGLIAFLFAALTPISWVRKVALPAFVAAVLCCVLAKFVGDTKGAGRWIRFAGMQFQPVEPARFFLILVIAWTLAKAGNQIATFRGGFVPAMGWAGLLAGALLLQPDNGNALIVLALASTMALVAGVRFLHFLPFGLAGFLAFTFMALQHGYVRNRLMELGNTTPGSQVGLGLIAVGSGGLFGRGLGQGWMKMGFVPEANNDFVFAIIAEELGYVGSLFVLTAFTAFGYVGYRLVCKVRDPFLRYVICGYSVLICVQAAVNLLVVSGWAPAKGIDLPFVSTGGTSLVFCLAAVGLIGNAARADQAGFTTRAELARG